MRNYVFRFGNAPLWATCFSLLIVLGSLTPPAIAFDPQPDPPAMPRVEHWWAGEGHAQDSAGNAHGTASGNPSFSPGRIGQAFRFDGVDDVISFGNEAGNFGTGDFTIEFWIKAPRPPVGSGWGILGKREFCNHGNFWEIRGSSLFVDQDSAGLNYFILSPQRPITDDQWRHMAYVRDGTTLRIFMDGKLVSSESFPAVTALSNTTPLLAGYNPCVAYSLETRRFTGLLDEIKLYHAALDPVQAAAAAGFTYLPGIIEQPQGATYNVPVAEHTLSVEAHSLDLDETSFSYQWHHNGAGIRGATSKSFTVSPVNSSTAGEYTVTISNRYGVYTSSPARIIVLSDNPLAPGPNHWWPGDGHAQDLVGNADGTTFGNLAYSAGRVGQAFKFDGVDDEISFGTEVGNFGVGDFTVEFWMQAPSNSVWAVLGKRGFCQHGSFWEMRGNAFALDHDDQGLNYTTLGAVPTASDGRWHHVTYVRADTNVWLYLDGALVSTKSTPFVAKIFNTAPLLAGNNPCVAFGDSTKRLNGMLDEIKIYHMALNASQIAAAANVRAVPRLFDRTIPKVVIENSDAEESLVWEIDPAPGDPPFTAEDLVGVDLESSLDLKIWTVIPGAVRLIQPCIRIVDPEAYLKRESFYRLVFRDPQSNNSDGGLIPISQVPAVLVAAAQEHIEEFIGEPEGRTAEDAEWVGVRIGPTARHVYDPAYKGATEPAFAELKIITPTGEDRGYILLALTPDHSPVVEFATEGLTKTERALSEIPGQKPKKFLRYNRSFIAMEDASANLLGTMGTWPALPDGEAPTEATVHLGRYDSETETRIIPPPISLNFEPLQSYSHLRAGFASNKTRAALRKLRTTAAMSRESTRALSVSRHAMKVGASQEFLTDQALAAVRVDADDESTAVRATLLGTGYRVEALREGTDLIRIRTRDGQILTHSFSVSEGLITMNRLAQCTSKSINTWYAGTGWNGDQRRYKQLKNSSVWCPAVGCGPVATAMLYGWWEANGVPSAFYKVAPGSWGEAHNFRFDFLSLLNVDSSHDMPSGGYPEWYVFHDLHKLGNTFCVNGQGATLPDDQIGAAVEYIERVSKSLPSPQDEFGEKLVGAVVDHSFTLGYWMGMTDWAGGGAKVANGIKAGRPGVVGLGDIVWDLHYALAYGYKRVDRYEGCGEDKELVDRRRWFKCNMGWGGSVEWHDAESVWFGFTANLWQKKLPN